MNKQNNDRYTKIDPKIKDILILLGEGAFLASSIVFPGIPIIASKLLKINEYVKKTGNHKDWQKFNLWRLRQILKRMKDAEYVEIKEENGLSVVKITKKGQDKILRYNIEKMHLDETKLDGHWRLVIYDIKTPKRKNSEMFRRSISKLKMLKLQKSVYITPFACEDEIEYLRQIYEIGSEVLILKVKNLENEQAYKNYFGI